MLFRACTTLTSVAVAAMDLTLLPEADYGDQGGRCLDGTMSGYYYEAPPSGESDLWVVYMQGGGACYSKETCSDRAKGITGSSKAWSATKNGRDVVSSDPSENPDFYDSHKVQIPYCTGDTHAGTVVTPTDSQWGFYFSGHLNFKGIISHLQKTISAFRNSKRFLLYGNSAGGAGVIVNCDFLQDTLAQTGSAATVHCAPMAGWFFPGFTEDQDDVELPPSDWAHWQTGQAGGIFADDSISNLYQSYHHPDCAKAHAAKDAFKCASASALYPYIKAPIYVIENQYDTNQLNAQLGLPRGSTTPQSQEYIAYFGRAMRNSTQQIPGKTGDGLFLASCLDHGVGRSTLIKGFDWFTGLGDWFYGRQGVPTILVDDCKMADPGLPCNPTCHSTPSGDGCAKAVQDLCSTAIVALCESCARNHQSELREAGCTSVSEVKSICSGAFAGFVV